MRWRFITIAAALVAAGTLGAVVFAQLSDTQTSSGTVNVSSTSADLYICEPDTTPGPACGSDDSGADEVVFEALENITPGGVAEWDLRLKNVGTGDWIVTGATLTIVETVDPGADCPNDALQPPNILSEKPPGEISNPTTAGVFIIADPSSDDPASPNLLPGVPIFLVEFFPNIFFERNIKVAAGDYEDVRLPLELQPLGTENCDGNEWNVSWVFTVQ